MQNAAVINLLLDQLMKKLEGIFSPGEVAMVERYLVIDRLDLALETIDDVSKVNCKAISSEIMELMQKLDSLYEDEPEDWKRLPTIINQ